MDAPPRVFDDLGALGDEDAGEWPSQGQIGRQAVEKSPPSTGAGRAVKVSVERGQVWPKVGTNAGRPYQEAERLLEPFAGDLL